MVRALFGLLIAGSVVGCTQSAARRPLVGSWHLSSYTPVDAVEVTFEDDSEVVLLRWFLSGFDFRGSGVVFGLTTREPYDFAVNRGQKGRYKVLDDGETLFLDDDIFGPTPGRVEEVLAVTELTEVELVVEDDEGTRYRFERAN